MTPPEKTPPAPGLYVHVPYCRSKCPYCGFYSAGGFHRLEEYLRAIPTELASQRPRFGVFDSLYLGGGTPSSLPLSALEALLTGIAHAASFAADLEWTVELNPGDVDEERLTLLKGAGVNRVSLGVQSFADAELRFLGRRHSADEARAALSLLRAAGFDNLGIDLIYGLPGQSLSDFVRSLDEAKRFAPAHLSCYQLTLEPGTPLGRRAHAGEIRLPDEDAQAQLFLGTHDFLTAAGFEHYEVSNFARAADLRSRHNQKAWRQEAYLGLGPAAHSFDGRIRFWNPRDLDAYLDTPSGALPTAGEETLTTNQRRLEAICLGIRTTDGIALALVGRQNDDPLLAKLLDEGLLIIDGERLCPTPRGLLLADGLARALS
jgi:putative oxygen-independent coproporphyrinogen III oxidase